MKGNVVYRLNTASVSNILAHLSGCDAEFVQELAARVDLTEYSRKIHARAERFEAWGEDTLVGLVAAYCNDLAGRTAYITSVSVLNGWQGKGIAGRLVGDCITHAGHAGMRRIALEVAAGNTPAIGLYERHGFAVTEAGGSFITMTLSLARGET